MDGVDLLPHVRGEREAAPHETLLWRHGDSKWAVRCGDWKLVCQGDEAPQLYHLGDDVSEERDRAAAEPDRVATMRSRFETWNNELIAPLWRYGKKGASKK